MIQIITIILLALFSNKGREINTVLSEIGLTSTVIADLVITIILCWQFVNFLSYLIINILPTNTKWVRLLVIVVLTVVATYIFGSTSTGSISDWLKPNVQYIIDILIFGGFDLWLINKYVESKIK